METTLISNPIIWGDVPDPDIIRHGEYFYSVSTTMHMMPGCPVMRSTDLVNWEIVNYVYDTYADQDKHNLANGQNIYGQGSWAACLREHEGKFYVCFSCNDVGQFYVYSTTDLENGPWECAVIPQLFHDPSMLFHRGKVYVMYGNGDIYITELTADASAIKAGGVHQLLLEGERAGIGLRCEGLHAYHIDGMFYLFFIEWPTEGNRRRRQLCYRSQQLLGPYEFKIVLDDDLEYHNKGVAQGGIVQASDGQWYSLLFQDHDAVGRIPVVVPVSWSEGWPVFGIGGRAPLSFEAALPTTPSKPIVISDDFNYSENKLALQWQWNHNPNNELWSLVERKGFLRLKTGEVTSTVLQARNTLTQRTEGPACEGVTSLDLSGMKPGDRAGLIALQSNFGTVGISMDANGQARLTMTINNGEGLEDVIEEVEYHASTVELNIQFNYENSEDIAHFYYRAPDSEWVRIGKPLHMKYTLDHFMGYRIGLFNYASIQSGGYADFEYFRYSKLANGNYQLISPQ